MDSRNDFILNAFNDLKARLMEHAPFNQSPLRTEESDFFEKFDQLLLDIRQQEVSYSFQAQDILAHIIRCYANLVPLIKRELLWFVGGECLHYLGDEEVDFFQELEDHLYQIEQLHGEVNIEEQIQSLRQTMSSPHTTH